MSTESLGTVVTFYSFKGGVGRSFLLANVAATLASWGYRVLCIDWDLEAPGLDQYFRDYLGDEPAGRLGLVDLIHFFDQGEAKPDWARHVTPIGLRTFTGTLDLMTAGLQDGKYPDRVQHLNWPSLYDKGFGRLLESLREQWVNQYDLVLIDSRTGITDIGGICTIQLPDILVPVFVANSQNLNGIYDVIQRATRRRSELPIDRPGLLVLPVLSRFEQQVEYALSLEWLKTIADKLDDVYENWLHQDVQPIEFLSQTKVPYIPYWSYGEKLAVLKESNPSPGDVSYSFQTIAALLVRRLADSQEFLQGRDRYLESAKRITTTQPARRMRVFLSSTTKDLQAYRHAVALAVRKLDANRYEFISSERWAPNHPTPSVAEIKNQMALTDVFVGLYGFRMGANCSDLATPVIEADYREAVANDIPVLAFFADEYAQIPPKFVERGEAAARVDAFRVEVASRHAVALFNTPDEVAKLVTAALARIEWPPRLPEEKKTTLSTSSEPNSPNEAPGFAYAKAGAVVGTLLFPGIGTVVGGLLGSFLGRSIGNRTPKKVYLSYRRDDGINVGRIYDALAKRYSPNNVFYDVDSIPPGVDFRSVISERLASSTIVLVIIGPEWLAAIDSEGQRRIDKPDDFVRLEIREALRSGRRILPVLMHRARIPPAVDLPKDIQGLAQLQSFHIRPDPDFQSDLARLMDHIDALDVDLPQTAPSSSSHQDG